MLLDSGRKSYRKKFVNIEEEKSNVIILEEKTRRYNFIKVHRKNLEKINKKITSIINSN